MLERVAIHQTRLKVPGIGLDSRGVALGARGLVLLPSLDRLIAFLAVYTESQTLSGLGDSFRVDVVKSKLGTREVALSFDAGASDRMDRVADVARLAGGFTFTGPSRHVVQYRDSAAPFGYDAQDISATDAALALTTTPSRRRTTSSGPSSLRHSFCASHRTPTRARASTEESCGWWQSRVSDLRCSRISRARTSLRAPALPSGLRNRASTPSRSVAGCST
ncbi:MAG: hypothetical protein U0263_06910 [Polyangiaceae bacterium]